MVIHRNDIILHFDSGVDASYTVTGDVGKLTVEVKDNKWHVSKVDCPNHVCERMGWMDSENYFYPIQCIPNAITIVSEDAYSN